MLKSGDSFGELALINHEPRAATIKCISSCYLAVLSKEDYAKVLRKSQLREQNQTMDFLKGIPFLMHQSQI